MCGIAGVLSASGVDPAVATSMADAIRHRGPDGEGRLLYAPGRRIAVSHGPEPPTWEGAPPSVVFAHRRLSILDLSERADQPMVHPSGEIALLYNGEAYNYLELRAELESRGHRFRSSGDSEVVLNAYAEWGPECVQRLVGMWAMAILDLRRDELFLSVDRFGIKPLYYAVAGDALHFASEIKALLAVEGLSPEPDEDTVRRYLLAGAVDQSERTFFEGIRRLRGGHNLTVPLDRAAAPPRPLSYWSLPEEAEDIGREEAASEFADLFADAVRVHLRSDVSVGTCLSGGLDSSAIVCTADRVRGGGAGAHYAHHGFGYVPADEEVSERRHMRAVAESCSLEMSYVEVSAEAFAEALPGIVEQQDEPFPSASIAAQWFVFDAARREGLKVMLDGQGADEVLGGYHHYLPAVGAMRLRGNPLRYPRLARRHRERHGAAPFTLRQAAGALAPRRLRRAAELRAGFPAAPLLSDRLRGGGGPPPAVSADHRSINELLAAHTRSLGLPALLRFEDRNSMAHSIEARVPFLDHRLVELCFRLPGELKIDGVETKRVLREGLREVLPEQISARRDKVGFRADPAVTWALSERHRELLLAHGTPYEERWFDQDGIERALAGADRSAEAEFMLWRVLNTKLWLRRFWSGERAAPALDAASR